MKGQVNIDYIGGFFIFMLAVVFISAAIMNTIPAHYQAMKENNLRIEVWALSERVLSKTTSNMDYLDKTRLVTLGSSLLCSGIWDDYNNRKNPELNVKAWRNFNLTILEFPIAVATTTVDNTKRSGTIKIEGIAMSFEIKDTTILSDGVFETFTSGGVSYLETQQILLGGHSYTVERIDPKGNFVILKRALINCGLKTPIGVDVVSTKRYSDYREDPLDDMSAAEVLVTYW